MVTYAGTQHSRVWGRFAHGTGEGEIVVSWEYFLIGLFIGVIVFWTGVYLEGRGRLLKDEDPTRR